MTMPPGWRKFALASHVAISVGLLGAVAAFLVLAIAGMVSRDDATVRAAYPAMALTAWLVILPLALASLIVGVIESLGTSWGLVRYYWVLAKLIVTVIATIVLLLQMRLIDYLSALAAARPLLSGELVEARMAMIVHSGGGLLVLLLPLVLSVYKPRGRTAYGRRRLPGES